MRALVSGLMLCAAAIPVSALAWNDHGHMAVAAVAWNHMSAAARARAAELLQRNPDYPQWVAGVAPADRARVAFLRAATWPDAIKSNKAYVDDGYTPADPHAGDIGDYSDKLMHKGWHFKDLAYSPDGTPTKPPFGTNAVTQIAGAEANLASAGTSDAGKSYSLAWLLHLVGDIHQPLHAVSRYTAGFPEGDVGGNKVRACSDQQAECDKRDELHAFWDDATGTADSVASVDATVASLKPADAAKVHDLDPGDWAAESEKLAEQVVYAPPIGLADKVYRLTRAYRAKARSVAAARVELAGERLAAILNRDLR